MLKKWKIIKKYPNYQVSNYGEVINIKSGKKRKLQNGPGGYLILVLYKDGKPGSVYIHRLVAEAFLGPCPKDKEVNHKDGNKINPYVKNLEYVTRKENVKHSYKIGLQEGKKGEKNVRSKLKNKDINKIIKMHNTKKYYQWEIAKIFGVHQVQISRIINGKTWNKI